MFITRVSRRELGDLGEFYRSQKWFEEGKEPDLKLGTAFVARQGPIIGALRLVEVAPNTVVVDDVVVAEEHRGKGVGAQLMQAAMNSRGGTLYLSCHDNRIEFYRRLGFELRDFETLPEPVQYHFKVGGDYPYTEDHVHYFMQAR